MLRSFAPITACVLMAACAGDPTSGKGGAPTLSAQTQAPPDRSTPKSVPAPTAAPSPEPAASPTGAASPVSSVIPTFQSSVRPAVASAGEPVIVQISVKNPGPEMLHVPDPRTGGEFLRLVLRLPSGEERRIVVGPPTEGGVQALLANMRVLSGQTGVIDFDLGERAPIGAPGSYKLSLEYAWRPGEVYRSPELSFTIKK